jgi:glycosyltransferase involved in cell wall biosynthesis
MRILTLSSCPLDPLLGSGKTRLRWSSGLRELGHSVEVAEPRDFETWHGLRRAIRFRQAFGASGFVKERLQTAGYDMIEFFGGEFGLATWQLSKLEERPLLVAHTDGLELLASEREQAYSPPVSIKGHLRRRFAAQTHERLSHAAFAYADAFVAGCELDRQYVLERGIYPTERAEVVEPGLDSEYLSMPFTLEKEERVVYTGSWIARKGIAVLTGVMTKVLNQKPGLSFHLYGVGCERETVLAEFPEGLRDRIKVSPRVSSAEIAEGLSKAKVFLFPTQYEGFGMALAEAMACGSAVVTTRTGFGAELRDGHEAILCDFDDVERMEQSVLRLLGDEALRARIARGGWERVQPLSWSANVKKLEATYSRWVEQHKRGVWKIEAPRERVQAL